MFKVNKKALHFLDDEENLEEAKNYVSEKDIKAIEKKAKKDRRRPDKKVRRNES